MMAASIAISATFFGIVATFRAGAAKNKIQPESWKTKIPLDKCRLALLTKNVYSCKRAKRMLQFSSQVLETESSALPPHTRVRYISRLHHGSCSRLCRNTPYSPKGGAVRGRCTIGGVFT